MYSRVPAGSHRLTLLPYKSRLKEQHGIFPHSLGVLLTLNISVVATLANAAQDRMERPPVCAFYDETRHLAGPLSLPPEGGTSYERENSQNERLGERGRWNPERLFFFEQTFSLFSSPVGADSPAYSRLF